MARNAKPLTPLQIQKLKDDGWYPDGRGLYLRVQGGRKRWVFRFELNGKRGEMGFGSAADVKLTDARDMRDAARKLLSQGKNPLEERRLEEERRMAEAMLAKSKAVTFSAFAESVANAIAPKAPKVRKAWLSQMTVHVGELAKMNPADITTEHVLKALNRPVEEDGKAVPYWQSRPEAGRRMRMRIEKVLNSANAAGLIPDIVNGKVWKNPARWEAHMELLLPQQDKDVEHYKAMHYDDVPDFMVRLRAETRRAARLVEFIILTAARNGEARGATWGEIDWGHKLWVIPKERMKMRRDHVVPLCDRAVEILESLKPENPRPDRFIFLCGLSRSGAFSENACQDLLEDMGLKGEATTHGFRAAFKTWAWEATKFDRDMVEMCLAHKVTKGAEDDYWRGDALAKRLKIMDAWAKYLAQPKPKDNVVRPRFRGRAA